MEPRTVTPTPGMPPDTPPDTPTAGLKGGTLFGLARLCRGADHLRRHRQHDPGARRDLPGGVLRRRGGAHPGLRLHHLGLDSPLIGAFELLVGLGILANQVWARVAGVVLTIVLAVSQIGFLAAFPIWSVLMIALCIVVIYALIVPPSDPSPR